MENIEYYKIKLDTNDKYIANTLKKDYFIEKKKNDLNKISIANKVNPNNSMSFSDSYETKTNKYKSTLGANRQLNMMGNKAISFMSEVD